MILAMGGDGTFCEIVNGLFTAPDSTPIPVLGLISTGTGNGLVQSLGLPEDSESQLDILLHGSPCTVDVGKIEHSLNGKRGIHFFLNECQVGLGARVVRSTSRLRKLGIPSLAYGITSLREALKRVAYPIRITNGERIIEQFQLLGIAVANGSRTAGGMQLVPGAKPDDGQLDALLILRQSRLQLALNLVRVYSGTHTNCTGFVSLQGRYFTLSSEVSVPVSVDGEGIGTLPCTISVLPGALQIQLPKGRKP